MHSDNKYAHLTTKIMRSCNGPAFADKPFRLLEEALVRPDRVRSPTSSTSKLPGEALNLSEETKKYNVDFDTGLQIG